MQCEFRQVRVPAKNRLINNDICTLLVDIRRVRDIIIRKEGSSPASLFSIMEIFFKDVDLVVRQVIHLVVHLLDPLVVNLNICLHLRCRV